MLDIER